MYKRLLILLAEFGRSFLRAEIIRLINIAIILPSYTDVCVGASEPVSDYC